MAHSRRPTSEIVFSAWTVDGTEPTSREDLFAVDPRTGAVRRLTDDPASGPAVGDRDPAWSPSRHRLVAMRHDGVSPMHLRVRHPDGSLAQDVAVPGTEPVWMTNRRILCCLARTDAAGLHDRTDIVAVSLPAATVQPVTAAAPGEHFASPSWHSLSGLVTVLRRMDPVRHAPLGGSRLVRTGAAKVRGTLTGGALVTSAGMASLTDGSGDEGAPAWSPDGTAVAFTTLRECATAEDGRRLRQPDVALLRLASPQHVTLVTDDSAGEHAEGLSDGSPAFSPDGLRLAWARGDEDSWARIMVQTLGDPASRRALVDDTHWWRGGLGW